jgi:hypothetical protein
MPIFAEIADAMDNNSLFYDNKQTNEQLSALLQISLVDTIIQYITYSLIDYRRLYIYRA